MVRSEFPELAGPKQLLSAREYAGRGYAGRGAAARPDRDGSPMERLGPRRGGWGGQRRRDGGWALARRY
jgi:hypothetical protein